MPVPWWSVLPFALLLACIAVLPLTHATAERLWEHNAVKLSVALSLGLPIAVWFTVAGAGLEVVHALVEYVQFMMLLLALFVVSGGIFLAGDIRATPRNNTIFLAVGAVIASFIGTTGAAMLLIRPVLNTNRERAHRVHTVVFTIFIVANCGGLLTPLGDPPLFPQHSEVELSWMILDPILDYWAAKENQPEGYAAGTWGPPSGRAMLERDGFVWRRP